MGCASSNDKRAPHHQQQQQQDPKSSAPAAQQQQQQTTKPNPDARSATAMAKATAAAPAAVSANVELSDLTEKVPFHDVYELGETLGKGNYSVVRKATLREDPSQVYAVKCIKEASLTQEDRDALKVETALLKTMDSPHIIKLYGFYEEPAEKMFYIVTEFVGGGELFDRIISKEYYSEEDAQKLVRTIATALQYIHSRGVVHRDLKPENILLTSKEDDDSIKLADFGFAKQYDTSSDDALSTSCGTPGYVSPEILNGKRYGKEVDMWSLGVIIYILLCGYPPFHHDNQKELFRQIRAAKYAFDEEYWGEVSDDAKDLIRKLLVVDGSKRLTVDQLLQHPWLLNKAKDTNLTDIQSKLKEEMNRRRLKASVHAVMVKLRMEKMIGRVQEAAADVEANGGEAAAAAASDAKPAAADGATAVKEAAAETAAEAKAFGVDAATGAMPGAAAAEPPVAAAGASASAAAATPSSMQSQ